MANIFENGLFIPTGLEIILYNDQEAKEWRKHPNIIAAEPLSCWKPTEAPSAFEGNVSRKRKRCSFSELEMENDKVFSLLELYKSNNVDEIIVDKETGETVLDRQELLKNLIGWTIEKRKRQEINGKCRVDKVYRHPKSKRMLRSLVEVKKFIEENSYIKKASDNSEGSSQDAPRNLYLQIFQRLEETFKNGAQQACNNGLEKGSSSYWSEQCRTISVPKAAWGSTSKSLDTMDFSLHSDRPIHFQDRMNEKLKEVPQSDQVFTDLMKTNQECMRAFAVPRDLSGGGSSSMSITSLDEIKLMVQSQVDAQLEARVAHQIAEKVSHYEKTQRAMFEKMESMHRLLLLGGLLPPSQ